MIPFRVTIRDERDGHKGKIYRREFTALAEDDACRSAADTLLMTDSMIEHVDFEIIGCNRQH